MGYLFKEEGVSFLVIDLSIVIVFRDALMQALNECLTV